MPAPDSATASAPALPAGSAVRQVALPLPMPRLFDYAVGETSGATVGCRVRVPFGRGSWSASSPGSVPAGRRGAGTARGDRVARPRPLFHGELLESLRWLAALHPRQPRRGIRNRIAGGAAPGRTVPGHAGVGVAADRAGQRPRSRACAPGSSAPAVRPTAARGALHEDATRRRDARLARRARALAQRGLIERVAHRGDAAASPLAWPEPNDEQRQAIDAVRAGRRLCAPLLLDGVTGSGKTEVYLRAIAECLRARAAGAGAGAGDRPDAAAAGALPRALRRAGACAAFSGANDNAARRVLAGGARAARRG